MGTAKAMLDFARADLGYLEKKSPYKMDDKTANAGSQNYTKYGERFGINGPDAYWCHMAVSCWARDSGNGAVIPWTALCDTGVSWFRARGRLHGRSGYTPKFGDIVYFSSAQYPNGGAHVGVVEKVDGQREYTIEGNTSGANGVIANGGGVCRKSYALNDERIYGYGSPDYDKEDDEMLTYEQFKAYMDKYRDETEKLPASGYAQNAWYALKDAGITDGTMPQAPMTREQVSVILQRLGLVGKE